MDKSNDAEHAGHLHSGDDDYPLDEPDFERGEIGTGHLFGGLVNSRRDGFGMSAFNTGLRECLCCGERIDHVPLPLC